MRGKIQSVINWFKNIPNKHLYKFLMFDIKDFWSINKRKDAMGGHKICQMSHFYN